MPLFSKVAVLKNTRLWSALKKMNNGTVPSVVELKGPVEGAVQEFFKKIASVPDGQIVCLSVEVALRESDRTDPRIVRDVVRHIMVVDTAGVLKRDIMRIINGRLDLNEHHFVLYFTQYDVEWTINWNLVSVGKRFETDSMQGKRLMSHPLSNIAKILKDRFPGYALTGYVYKDSVMRRILTSRGFNHVYAYQLDMESVMRQVKGYEGADVAEECVFFAKIPEPPGEAVPFQRTINDVQVADAFGRVRQIDRIIDDLGLRSDLDGQMFRGQDLKSWSRDHGLFLSYPAVVDIYGEADAERFAKRLYGKDRSAIEDELITYSRQIGKADDTSKRLSGIKDKKQLWFLALWMGKRTCLLQYRQELDGKLFGIIDIAGLALKHMPIWPVDDRGNVREDLIEWMRYKDRSPPPEYYLVRKVPYEKLYAQQSPESPGGAKAKQLTLNLGTESEGSDLDALYQEGGKTLGSSIGTGLVFSAQEDPAVIMKTLSDHGVAQPKNAIKVYETLQRYFRFIPRRDKERTYAPDAVRIEFKKDITHFLHRTSQGKINIDIRLLQVDPDDIVPFLSFVLAHEGSHGLPQVGANAAAAEKLDRERFSKLSARHQRSVLRALKALGARRSYVQGLSDAAAPWWALIRRLTLAAVAAGLVYSYVSDYREQDRIRQEVNNVVVHAQRQAASNENLDKYVMETLKMGPAVIPALVERLGDNDKYSLFVVMNALERFGAPAIAPLGKVLLSDAPASVRGKAAEILGKIKDQESIDLLMKAVDTPDDEVRNHVVQSLYIHRKPELAGVFVRAMSDRHPHIREIAIYTLGKLKYGGGVEPLHRALEGDAETKNRLLAAQSLGEIGLPASVEALGKTIARDPDPAVRAMAIASLENINDKRCADMIAGALTQRDPDVRFVAACALGRLHDVRAITLLPIFAAARSGSPEGAYAEGLLSGFKDPESVKKYIGMFKSAPDKNVTMMTVRILSGIGMDAAPLLREALGSDNPNVRVGALMALRNIGDRESAPAVRKLLVEDPVDVVRAVAVSFCMQMPAAQDAESLVRALKDQNAEIRIMTAIALGMLGEAKTAAPVREALVKETDVKARTSMVIALGKLHDAGAVDLIVKLLGSDPDVSLRTNAAYALAEIGGKKALDAVARACVSDTDSDVRKIAATGLGAAGDRTYLATLVKALEDDEYTVRFVVAQALGMLRDTRATAPLLSLMKGESKRATLSTVARALRDIGDASRIGPLLEMLQDKTNDVRREMAVVALHGAGGAEVSRALCAVLAGDTEYAVRHEAAGELAYIKSDEALAALRTAALRDSVAEVRIAAVQAIERHADRGAVPVLLAAMKDADERVREAAASALGEIRDGQCIAALIDLLVDPEANVHQTAAKALSRFLLDPSFAAQHENIQYALGEYLVAEIITRPVAGLSLLQTNPYVLSNLVCRRNDIEAGTLSVDDLTAIYANGAFASATKDIGACEQYAVARSVELTLKRFGVAVAEDTIGIVLPYANAARQRYLARRVIDTQQNVIIGMNDERMFEHVNIGGFARGFGCKNVKEYRGYEGKKDLLSSIAGAEGPTTVWLHGHGSPHHFWMNMMIFTYDDDDADMPRHETISYKELSDALIKRAGKNNGDLSDMTIVIDACYSADYVVNTLNLLAGAYANGAVRGLPVIVTATNRGTVGYLNKFLENVKAVSGKKDTLTLRDIRKAEELATIAEDYAFFLPLTRDELEAMKKALGYTVGNQPEDVVSTSLPMIDNFVPLVQTGGTETGTMIGGGLVFPWNAYPSDIVSSLDGHGVALPAGAEKTIAVMQRYFSFIRARAPDKTVDAGHFQIEFRKDVAHYAAIEGDKIIVDVALLDIAPRDLLPFLSFVIAHESSHRLASVGRDEAKAQAMDGERFAAFGARNRRAVLDALTRLGADPAYLASLKDAAAKAHSEKIVRNIIDRSGRPDSVYALNVRTGKPVQMALVDVEKLLDHPEGLTYIADALDRWMLSEAADVVHRDMISQLQDWMRRKRYRGVYAPVVVISPEGNVEGIALYDAEEKTIRLVEIAPWNRDESGEFRMYKGVGHQLFYHMFRDLGVRSDLDPAAGRDFFAATDVNFLYPKDDTRRLLSEYNTDTDGRPTPVQWEGSGKWSTVARGSRICMVNLVRDQEARIKAAIAESIGSGYPPGHGGVGFRPDLFEPLYQSAAQGQRVRLTPLQMEMILWGLRGNDPSMREKVYAVLKVLTDMQRLGLEMMSAQWRGPGRDMPDVVRAAYAEIHQSAVGKREAERAALELLARLGVTDGLQGDTIFGTSIEKWAKSHRLFLESQPDTPDYERKQFNACVDYYKSRGATLESVEQFIMAYAESIGEEVKTRQWIERLKAAARRDGKPQKSYLMGDKGPFMWAARRTSYRDAAQMQGGKLFGAFDLAGMKLRDLPIWPVDDQGSIREELCGWMAQSGSVPPPAYFRATKIPLAKILSKVSASAIQPTLSFDEDPGAAGCSLALMEELFRRARTFYRLKEGRDASAEKKPRELIEYFLRHINSPPVGVDMKGACVEELPKEDVENLIKSLPIDQQTELPVKVLLLTFPADRHGAAVEKGIVKEEGGVRAVNFRNAEGGWTVVIEKGVHERDMAAGNTDTLRHELMELGLRDWGYDWIEAHNRVVKETKVGAMIDKAEAQKYVAVAQGMVGAAEEKAEKNEMLVKDVYMRVKEPHFSERSIKDGTPVSFAHADEAKAFGEGLVAAGRADKFEKVEVLGRTFDIIIEQGAGFNAEMVQAMISEAVNRTKDTGGDISKLPATLVFAILDRSSHLFEDHVANGFIGINRVFYSVRVTELPAFKMLLRIGLFHELCHEATGDGGAAFEDAQMLRDADLTAELMVKQRGTDYGVIAPILRTLCDRTVEAFLETVGHSLYARAVSQGPRPSRLLDGRFRSSAAVESCP
ncbi:MAG TPA: HEAT repeat domain-containing protein [bacterium]|nr:HEAT repeat domain-containing protein [bacterium]